MEFNTRSSTKRRKMIFVPDLNPNTFLLFFEKGDSGYSYSVRDYSVRNRVSERYAREFHWSAHELCQKARFMFDAPTIDTNNLSFWHTYTVQGIEFLRRSGALAVAPPDQTNADDNARSPIKTDVARFPVLNLATFQSLPKFAKTADIERILTSPRSEDWVTWNLLNLLLVCRPDTWWDHLVACAKKANPDVAVPMGTELPQLGFWRLAPSPKLYEKASRERMRVSKDPLLIGRSKDPKPVEGNSEIDVVIESGSFVIYIEAKLEADISMRTTYDPCRNQIVRNIDCLLEAANGRSPLFWMFVRDVRTGRAYVELMRQYQEKPELLFRELPHRDPAALKELARGLVLLTWRDISTGIGEPAPGDNDLKRSVKQELQRRIQ